MASSKIKKELPDLFLFKEGEWDSHQENLYKIFQETLINKKNYFQGTVVSIRKVPEYKGKHFAFWHLISEGEKEEERTPDLRRCERLSWISWVIENSMTCPDISWWENNRKNKKNIVIWYEKENYAVILAKRNKYLLLKTAYLTTSHRANSFRKEREVFNKKVS